MLCASLVVFLLSSYTTAMVPSWLSAVSFKCKGKKTCVGTVIDKQWILTTDSCFQSCDGTSPKNIRAFLNISGNSHKRRVSLKTGSKVSVEDVWMHPRYNPITSANNLALVKLECHDITLHISADLWHTVSIVLCQWIVLQLVICILPRIGWDPESSIGRLIDTEGNITLSHCSVKLGMDAIYFCTNQPVAVSSHKISECVQRQRTVPATPICHHIELIRSVLNGGCESNVQISM